MLEICTRGPRLCDALTRRQMLHVGGLGLLGLSLPGMLRGQSAERRRAKSCILLFLMGGPPQHSTWDPKPDGAGGDSRAVRADRHFRARRADFAN